MGFDAVNGEREPFGLSAFLFTSKVLMKISADQNPACLSNFNDTPLYKDPTASVDERVADLIPRMTLAEKISQITQGECSPEQACIQC
jgi:hypothetical protein